MCEWGTKKDENHPPPSPVEGEGIMTPHPDERE